MVFEKHPSYELVELFKKKPYQGACPEKARIIFLGSDANYSPKITNHDFFKYILEYHKDGIAFWERYKVHHPFLHSKYPKGKEFGRRKDGVPYHRNFSKIGLDSSYAKYISFMELLDIPTMGMGKREDNNKRFDELVNPAHLKRIDELITSPGDRLIFVSKGVLEDMLRLKRKYDLFGWLPEKLPQGEDKFVYEDGSNSIQKIYHFSSWQIHAELPGLKVKIDDWLKRSTGS